MSDLLCYTICGVLIVLVLVGISMMSRVKTAVTGNLLSALATACAIVVTLYKYEIFTDWLLWVVMAISLVVALIWARNIKMIEMPQVVALLNGFGGLASALVAIISMMDGYSMSLFGFVTGGLALAVGMVTLSGSLMAAGKLHKVLPQKPVIWKNHQAITMGALVLTLVTVGMIALQPRIPLSISVLLCAVVSSFFGIAFAIRVGGADMPITISLLNSLSGVAGSIAGMAIGDPLLVAIGGVVGASGLLLTQIMCRSMNRRLGDILTGKTAGAPQKASSAIVASTSAAPAVIAGEGKPTYSAVLADAQTVIVIPGYGMALAQAQSLVKQLADTMESQGKQVDFAIHPVAGRMPGHMNVLLAEADVPYEKLREMDDINPSFATCDLAIVIGANDVVNPAAKTAEGTPIYGMPVLNVEQAKHVIICNYDKSPGYAGVDNPLYERENATLLLGDASQTLQELIQALHAKPTEKMGEGADQEGNTKLAEIVENAKSVIIVPGYGMALAQAQRLVKQLADFFESTGKQVDFAIHPVAGRMPGHMNVLLAEADVPYEKLREMDDINPSFATCDLAIVIGANDVVNPAANTAEGTPIYGMPVLNVEQAKHVIICNYDKSPGYAGVDNPLYERENATLLLGDASQTLLDLLALI